MALAVRKIGSVISQSELREMMSYDPATGILTWLVKIRSVNPGDRVGCRTADGYRVTKIRGLKVPEHRLIWFWMTGEDPDLVVEHRSGVRDENRWDNLRLASESQNQWNADHGPDVGLRELKSGWQASISQHNQRHVLGVFTTKDEAREARRAAEGRMFGEFACSRR